MFSASCSETAFLSLLCSPPAWGALPSGAYDALFACFQAYFLYFATKSNDVTLPVRTFVVDSMRCLAVRRAASALLDGPPRSPPFGIAWRPAEPNTKTTTVPTIESQVLPSRMAGIDALWAMASSVEHERFAEVRWPTCRLCDERWTGLVTPRCCVVVAGDPLWWLVTRGVVLWWLVTRGVVLWWLYQSAATLLVALYSNVVPNPRLSLTHRSVWEQFAFKCTEMIVAAGAVPAPATVSDGPATAPAADKPRLSNALALLLRFISTLHAKGPVKNAKASMWRAPWSHVFTCARV